MSPSRSRASISICSAIASVPKPISAPSAPSTNDSRMKLSLPVSTWMRLGASERTRTVSTNRTASNDASLIATTFGIETSLSSVSLREDARRPAPAGAGRAPSAAPRRLRDRAVVLVRHLGRQRLANEHGMREDDEPARARVSRVQRHLDSSGGARRADAGEHGQPAGHFLRVHLEHAAPLVAGQRGPLAGVHVHRERLQAIEGEQPADVAAESVLVDFAVRPHRRYDGGDQAREVKTGFHRRRLSPRMHYAVNRPVFEGRANPSGGSSW